MFAFTCERIQRSMFGRAQHPCAAAAVGYNVAVVIGTPEKLTTSGWLKYALCWRGLTIFSKISYSVYLTQFLGFFYNVGTTRTSQEFTAFTSVAAAGGLVNSKKTAIGFSQTGRYGL
uniref:Uncharacterized protein n=1 Tax=Timema douglasi TaxID=61478 RepID=A0A7R8VV23_TIMDO|nr:unnamed protein product [Timema douglasi]